MFRAVGIWELVGIWEQNSGMNSRENVNIIGNNENNASGQHLLGILLQRDCRKDLVIDYRKRKWCQLAFLFCNFHPVLFGIIDIYHYIILRYTA